MPTTQTQVGENWNPTNAPILTPQQLLAQDPSRAAPMVASPLTSAANAPMSPTPQITTPAAPTTTPTVPTTNLAPGAQGTDVQGLQNYLASLGYLTPQQIATGPGIYGPQTQAAVTKLQKDLGVDTGGYAGFYGQKTQAALAKKYQDAFSQTSGAVPQNGAEARSALEAATSANQQETDTQQSFYDSLFNLNPVEGTIFQQLTNALSTTNTQQTLRDLYAQEIQTQGLPALNLELADTKRIMDGTEDDIREEITKSGGFATESQVQALATARNKVLLRKASYLADVINAKNDYVDRIVSLTQADRKQVSDDIDRKLGLTKTIFDMQQSLQKNARENYQKIVDNYGYGGLASALQGDKKAMSNAEKILGLAQGSLSNKAFTSLGKAKEKYQFISGTENQASGVFDPNTGAFTPSKGATGGSKPAGVGSSTGDVARDAESIMDGSLNLPDISQKNNYRAQVAAELNRRAKEALAEGDIYGYMRASAVYDKEPGDTFLTPMEKTQTVISQIATLQDAFDKGYVLDENGKPLPVKTGPIVGAFKSANPWDTNAQVIKAQLNAIVPNLARGVYGEVGVLTDNDIKVYSKTLPNLTSTEAVRNAILYITADQIRKNLEIKIRNQAAGQRDVSGYAPLYSDFVGLANSILSKIPNANVPPTTTSPTLEPSKGQRKMYNGYEYIFNGSNWVLTP